MRLKAGLGAQKAMLARQGHTKDNTACSWNSRPLECQGQFQKQNGEARTLEYGENVLIKILWQSNFAQGKYKLVILGLPFPIIVSCNKTCQLLRSIFLFLLQASLIKMMQTGCVSVLFALVSAFSRGKNERWKVGQSLRDALYGCICPQWDCGYVHAHTDQMQGGLGYGNPRYCHSKLLGDKATLK